MESLSTAPKAMPVVSLIFRSHRVRSLTLLMAALTGLYLFFLSTTQQLSPSPDILENALPLQMKLLQLINGNEIMVFSKSYCPYSASAKKLLKSYTQEVTVMEVDLEDDTSAIKTILTKITHGHSTFPSILFHGESIGGFDNLQAMEMTGDLKQRINVLAVAP